MTAKQETIALYAKQLRLPTFAGYKSTLRQMDSQTSYEDFLLELMKNELASRQENQQKRRIKSGGFPFLKTLDEFDFERLKHVKEPFIWELASCDYIRNRQNVIMIGTPGTGNYRKFLLMERNKSTCLQYVKCAFISFHNTSQ